MKKLSSCLGQHVDVAVHSPKDKTFKKSAHQTLSLPFDLSEPLAALLQHVTLINTSFQIKADPDCAEKDAAQIFYNDINLLNTVMTELSKSECVAFVAKYVEQEIDRLGETIRKEEGYLIKAFMANKVFAESIERYLETKGYAASCNIQRGTLFVSDNLVINSGITRNTTLTTGLFNALRMTPDNADVLRYEQMYYKAPQRHFEAGIWLDKQGDTPYTDAFSAILLGMLRNFVSFMHKNLGSDIVAPGLVEAIEEQYEKQVAHIDTRYHVDTLDKTTVMTWPAIKNSQAYQEIELLGLGQAAKDAFYERELSYVVLNELKSLLGAIDTSLFDAYQLEKDAQRHGYVSETYCDSVPLPNAKVRAALLTLQSQIASPESLFNYFFDAQQLKIKIACDARYDSEHDIFTHPRQYLDIVAGAKMPIANASQVLRFTFED